MRLKALTDLDLRKSSNPKDELYEEWFHWKKGATFDAPKHMNVERAIERGIVEKMSNDQK